MKLDLILSEECSEHSVQISSRSLVDGDRWENGNEKHLASFVLTHSGYLGDPAGLSSINWGGAATDQRRKIHHR